MTNNALENVMSKIAIAARDGNLSEVERLTPIATRLRQLMDHRQSLEEEEKDLAERVSLSTFQPLDVRPTGLYEAAGTNHRTTRRATRGGLCVEMDLPHSGKVRQEENTAAETMVAVMERLLAEFGIENLAKLQNLRTGRGPLLSRRPSVDFLNPKKGDLYAHHRVPGTDFYVLTHSATPEKVEHLEQALKLMGLQPTKFRVFREQM